MEHRTTGGFGAAVPIIVIALLAAGGVAYIWQQEAVPAADEMMKDDLMPDKAAMTKDDLMPEESIDDVTGGDSMEKPDMMPQAGSYEAYSRERLALAEQGRVVLFFKASWCPTCRALDGDISASRSDIPSGVHILAIDYDSATALRQQYGVTSQHTLVEVDAAGNELQQWSGGLTLETILQHLN